MTWSRHLVLMFVLAGAAAGLTRSAHAGALQEGMFGGGVAYHFEAEELGLQGKAFFPTKLVEISPSVTWYVDSGAVSFDADGHLALPFRSAALFNAFAGVDVTADNSESEVGINLGLAARLGLSDKIKGYGEFKYIFSDFDSFVLSAGILF